MHLWSARGLRFHSSGSRIASDVNSWMARQSQAAQPRIQRTFSTPLMWPPTLDAFHASRERVLASDAMSTPRRFYRGATRSAQADLVTSGRSPLGSTARGRGSARPRKRGTMASPLLGPPIAALRDPVRPDETGAAGRDRRGAALPRQTLCRGARSHAGGYPDHEPDRDPDR